MTKTDELGKQVANDRVLSIEDVCEIFVFCPVTASKFIKETGHAIYVHRRIFILESNLMKYLRGVEKWKG